MIFLLERIECRNDDDIAKLCIEALNENLARIKASMSDGDRWMHKRFATCRELTPEDPEWEMLQRLGLVKTVNRNFEGGGYLSGLD